MAGSRIGYHGFRHRTLVLMAILDGKAVISIRQINIGWNIHGMCMNGLQEGQKAKYRFTPHPFKKM